MENTLRSGIDSEAAAVRIARADFHRDALTLSLLDETRPTSLARPIEFAQKNILNPIVNHALLEPFNTVASLVEQEKGALQVPLLSVPREAFLTPAWAVQTVSSGVGAVLPYAIAGKAVNGSLRFIGARCGADGATAAILKNEAISNVAGAALYDGFRPLREGESRIGNIAGGVVAFSAFGVANHFGRNLTGGWQIAARGAAGFAGADMQLLVSRYATDGSVPKFEEFVQAGVAGSVMNNILPVAQDAVSRKISEAKFNLGFSTPADRYARINFAAEMAAPELPALLAKAPWLRVQRGLHNDFSIEGNGVIKLAPGRSTVEEFTRGIARILQSKEAPQEHTYKAAAEFVQQGNHEEAWKLFQKARALEETAAHHDGQLLANKFNGRDVLKPENLVLEMGAWPAPGGVSYEMRWRQEFQNFIETNGAYRPGKKLATAEPFVPKDAIEKPVDRSLLSESERIALEQRDVAAGLVADLQKEGYIAAFAGGAVRDEYRGIKPKDYDIATSATPEQISRIFEAKGYKLELTGQQFGVIRVRINGVDYEIATLRNDGNYTDGRRPDRVKFVPSLVEDSARRDLTCNAMFKDPLTGKIYDFFGGQRDLDAKVLRSVGDPAQRFAEDYLRMMRVPRLLSSKFVDFTVHPDTVEGLKSNAHKITGVASERLRDELRMMLIGKQPLLGLDLMMETGLMKHMLPEVAALKGSKAAQDAVWHAGGNDWQHTRLVVGNLAGKGHRFETMLSGLLHKIGKPATQEDLGRGRISDKGHAEVGSRMIKDVAGRLKLTTKELRDVQGTVLHHMDMHQIAKMSPAEVKRLLGLPYVEDLIALQHADALGTTHPDRASHSMLDFIRAKQREYATGHPSQRVDAQPIINGETLGELGIKPGKRMGEIKNAAMEAQQNGLFNSREGGLEWLRQNIAECKPSS